MDDIQEKSNRLILARWIILGLFLVIITTFLLTARSIYYYSKQNRQCQSDVAVVLGAAVWTDHPSPVFKERINYAIELYKNGKINKIIFTGGKSKEDNISEAEAARDYAKDRGVNDNDILIENQSWTTYTNLVNAKEIIQQNNFGKVMVISDPLHLKRAKMIADGLHISACTASTPTTRYKTISTKLPFLMRETYFYLEHFIVKM